MRVLESGVLCSLNTAILEYYHVVLSTAHLVLIYTLEHCSPSAPYFHLEHCIYTRVSMRNLECYNQFSSITIPSRAFCNAVLRASPLVYKYTPTLKDKGHRTDFYYPTVLTFFCTHHISSSYLFINPSLLALTSPFSIDHSLLSPKQYLPL